MNQRLVITALVAAGIAVFSVQAFAQDELPTKTPTPTAEPLAENTAAPPDAVFTIEEPFIQSDLELLSGNVQRPNALFWHNDKVYAACNGDWTIYEIEADSGATVTYLWGIRNAHTLYAEDDENGDLNLWVPDYQTNSLIRIYQRNPTTIVEGLSGPWGIVPLDEDFLITNLLGNSMALVGREGAIRDVATNLRSPAGVVVHENAVYVANNGSARRAIEWFDVEAVSSGEAIDTSELGGVEPLVSGLQNPTGIVVGPDEYLYIAYSLGTRGVIGRVDPMACREKGGCTNNEVEIVVYTDLAAPLAGLAISPDFRLYTHTIFSPDIYYVDLMGDSSAVISQAPAGN